MSANPAVRAEGRNPRTRRDGAARGLCRKCATHSNSLSQFFCISRWLCSLTPQRARRKLTARTTQEMKEVRTFLCAV